MSKGAKKRLAECQEIEQKAMDTFYRNSDMHISRELDRRAGAFYRNYAALLRVRQAERLLK